MKTLTFDDIKNAPARATESVDVPEWGGSVRLREWSGAELLDFYGVQPSLGKFDVMLRVVAQSLVGDDGAPVFPDVAAGVEVLRDRPYAIVMRLCEVAMRLNKLNAAASDELVKNSEASRSGDSPTDSPITST
jgi:hypothetical protein